MENEYRIESLEASEIAYLEKQERKERRLYNKLLVLLLSGSAVISFAGAWKYVKAGNLTLFSWENYCINAAILMFICSAAVWFSKQMSLKKLQTDIEARTKIVERAMITGKTFLHQNNTYFFYLNSEVKLSIEVSATYFNRLCEGDEINIEYTTYARIYFGYY